MNINRDNYEAYFLDFIEGRLSPEQEEVLHRFLKFNPDLEAELASFQLHEIDATHVPFPGKDSLKKEPPADGITVNEANFDMFCIAWLERDLSEAQRKSFETYLAEHPEKEKELQAFKATFLEPVQIEYPHKSRLKHRRTPLIDWRIMVPVAAAAAIALMVILNGPATQTTMEVATVTGPDQAGSAQTDPEQVVPLENEEQPVQVEEDQQRAVPQVQQATFNMVRKTNSPVPVSDFTDEEKVQLQEQNNRQEKQAQSEISPRIAGLELGKKPSDPIPVRYDQIRAESIRPPAINSSSLSILALARYQAQRASQIMEEEDALLWSLASSGIREINRITGSETQLMASRDEDGAISGIRFKSRFLNVTAPIDRDN